MPNFSFDWGAGYKYGIAPRKRNPKTCSWCRETRPSCYISCNDIGATAGIQQGNGGISFIAPPNTGSTGRFACGSALVSQAVGHLS